MSGDDAQELRDTTIRHDERIRVVEDAISEQKPMLQAIQLTRWKALPNDNDTGVKAGASL